MRPQRRRPVHRRSSRRAVRSDVKSGVAPHPTQTTEARDPLESPSTALRCPPAAPGRAREVDARHSTEGRRAKMEAVPWPTPQQFVCRHLPCATTTVTRVFTSKIAGMWGGSGTSAPILRPKTTQAEDQLVPFVPSSPSPTLAFDRPASRRSRVGRSDRNSHQICLGLGDRGALLWDGCRGRGTVHFVSRARSPRGAQEEQLTPSSSALETSVPLEGRAHRGIPHDARRWRARSVARRASAWRETSALSPRDSPRHRAPSPPNKNVHVAVFRFGGRALRHAASKFSATTTA